MKSPPQGVKLVMEAVCILKGVKPTPRDTSIPGAKVYSYWESAKKLLGEMNFLQSLLEFDKENIPASIIDKIKPYIDDPEFHPSKIQKISQAATSLCAWVRAIEKYHQVLLVVKPKRLALSQAEEKLNEVLVNLAAKKHQLAEIEKQIEDLMLSYKEAMNRKQSLEDQVNTCETQLERAKKLLGALGGEKERWKQAAFSLDDSNQETMTGDVLLSAGVIAYLGAFTGAYRQQCLALWYSILNNQGSSNTSSSHRLTFSGDFSLAKICSDAVTIRSWNLFGLPQDKVSIENAVIVRQSNRWPLIIDPQGQANRWIKNMESNNNSNNSSSSNTPNSTAIPTNGNSNNTTNNTNNNSNSTISNTTTAATTTSTTGKQLVITTFSDGDVLRKLENAIRYGHPVLLEDVNEGEQLKSIEPLLLKQITKQGNTNVIRLGDSLVEYSDEFRLYITTKHHNPQLSPDISTKVTLLNFTVTMEGLQDQLLGMVVAKERPDLEEQKNKLVVENAWNKKRLKETEGTYISLNRG